MTTRSMEKRLGLMLLRLIRQLPEDNRVRKEAVALAVEAGLCDLGHIMRQDEFESAIADIAGFAHRLCGKCGGAMAHYRLKGYRCPRCG